MRRGSGLLLLVCILSVEAQDRPGNTPPPRPHVRGTAEHVGEFPEPPPKEDDTVFSVDTGSGLDTGCTYRAEGPLRIQLPVRRHVGKVNGNGTLTEPNRLVALGLVSRNAQLRLPVFDVDQEGDPFDPSAPPEVDRVRFNGHLLDQPLTGSNENWKMNTYTIDIAWVKFPAPGAGPAMNEIEIEIDTRSTDEDTWCTAVDWVSIQFRAVAPVFLVHGIFSNGQNWTENGFAAALSAAEIPFSHAINLPELGSTAANGRLLAGALQREADKLGAKKCHIVGHSKGGLDTRAYLRNDYDPEKLKVLSVYTLSTPHRGSPLADIIYGATLLARNPNLNKLLNVIAPALADLTTVKMLAFNLFYPPPAAVPFVSYGAEADHSPRNHFINSTETAGLRFPLNVPAVATLTYNVVGHADRAVVFASVPLEWGDTHFPSLVIPLLTPFVPNDTVVSRTSAAFGRYANTEFGNHTTVKSPDVAKAIVGHIVANHGAR